MHYAQDRIAAPGSAALDYPILHAVPVDTALFKVPQRLLLLVPTVYSVAG